MKLKLIALFLLAAAAAAAQSITVTPMGGKQNGWVVDATFLPNTATDALITTVAVCYLEVSNQSSSSTTVTIQDRQSTPIAILPGATIPAKTTWWVLTLNPASGMCRRFVSGINWSAGASNAVAVTMMGVQ